MKTIIAGSRKINFMNYKGEVDELKYKMLENIIKEINCKITKVISGGARGIDTFAIEYAKRNNLPVDIYMANWELYGKKAGSIRNCEMSKQGECLIAIWDGESRGTKHMIDIAKEGGLLVYTYNINNKENKLNVYQKENLGSLF